MSHGRRPLQQWARHLHLEQVRKTLRACGLVRERGGRALAYGPAHLARPDGNAVARAARSGLEPGALPIAILRMKARLAAEAVQVGADELAVLHADAGIVDEVRHAPRGVDPIVRAVGRARLGLDDFDPVLEALLDDQDARQPRIWRRERDVDFPLVPTDVFLIVASCSQTAVYSGSWPCRG